MKKRKQKIILKGIPASKGIAEGKVKIILNPSQCSEMREGDVLVTEITNPLFTPAIVKAKAIITEKGGMLCHAAMIARELNIPCIVSAGKATKFLKDGQQIVINGDKGIVYEG